MSVLPDKFTRYQKFISFMLKYWNSDLLNRTTAQAMGEEIEDENKETQFDRTPDELVEDLKEMGPTYIKMGQLLSTRPDLLPEPYLVALSCLQDDVPPISYKEVHEIVEREIGTRISKAFQSFDEVPLASASIGQVHSAVLRSGKPVAVKIQRPGIRKKFLEDLDTLQEVATLAVKHTKTARKYAFDDVLAELSRILIQELDYLKEAQNLITLGKNLGPYDNLIVPQPIQDYSTSRVLTMEYVDGKKVTALSPLKQLETDFKPLVNELVEAYLQQIVTDGFVHADPHPGNVHLTADNKIALMDLGMVAKFTPKMQDYVLQLLIAISKNDGDETTDVVLKMSKMTPEASTEIFRKIIGDVLLDSRNSMARDMKTGRLLIQMNRLAAENGIHLPVEINILGKVLLNMDQIIAVLDPEYDLQNAIKEHLGKMLRDKMLNELKPENFFAVMLEAKKLTENMPERLNKITEDLANHKFRFKIDAIDEHRLTDGFQKVANRITLGLVIAAMIIGAAMLMQVPSDFTILGYPGLAMLFFLLAAVGGILLSYIIIFKDEGLNYRKKDKEEE